MLLRFGSFLNVFNKSFLFQLMFIFLVSLQNKKTQYRLAYTSITCKVVYYTSITVGSSNETSFIFNGVFNVYKLSYQSRNVYTHKVPSVAQSSKRHLPTMH